MKLKIVFYSILVIFVLSVSLSSFYAEDATVGTSTFTVPDDFSAYNMTENITMLTDENYTNVIYIVEGDVNSSEGRSNLLNKGYRLMDESDYVTDGGIHIHQENYQKDRFFSCLYAFKINDKSYLVSYTLPVGAYIPEDMENPVSKILDTLK